MEALLPSQTCLPILWAVAGPEAPFSKGAASLRVVFPGQFRVSHIPGKVCGRWRKSSLQRSERLEAKAVGGEVPRGRAPGGQDSSRVRPPSPGPGTREPPIP